jgi:hypothetical protein
MGISYKRINFVAFFLLMFPQIAAADSNHDENEPKIVSGMSIVGNDEAPKSLYIVPWKNKEVGKEVILSSSFLNEELRPVDKSDFIRELDFYKFSNPK